MCVLTLLCKNRWHAALLPCSKQLSYCLSPANRVGHQSTDRKQSLLRKPFHASPRGPPIDTNLDPGRQLTPSCTTGREKTAMPQFHCATIVSNPFQENTFVANLEGQDDCLIVDPGLEPDKITAYLADRNLQPAAILITHGHSDHIGGNHALKARWPECPLIVSVGDAEKLTDPLKISPPNTDWQSPALRRTGLSRRAIELRWPVLNWKS